MVTSWLVAADRSSGEVDVAQLLRKTLRTPMRANEPT
jgi:hypothetical protein